MAIEMFVQLDRDGDQLYGGDHIFTGPARDLKALGRHLQEIFASNRRAKSVQALAVKFETASETLFVRLTVKECQTLVNSLESFAEGKPKTSKAKKYYSQFSEALSVF